MQRYFDVSGRENVHVIIFDDLKHNTPEVYRSTLRFLSVDEQFAPPFEVVNPNKRQQAPALNALIRHPVVQRIGRRLVPLRIANRIADGLRSLGTKVETRPPLDDRMRARLREEFAPDVGRLSELLGRDLSSWVRA